MVVEEDLFTLNCFGLNWRVSPFPIPTSTLSPLVLFVLFLLLRYTTCYSPV
jgi:hypothetical protein